MKKAAKTGAKKSPAAKTSKTGSSKKGRSEEWKMDKKDEAILDRAWASVAGGRSKPAGKKRK